MKHLNSSSAEEVLARYQAEGGQGATTPIVMPVEVKATLQRTVRWVKSFAVSIVVTRSILLEIVQSLESLRKRSNHIISEEVTPLDNRTGEVLHGVANNMVVK